MQKSSLPSIESITYGDQPLSRKGSASNINSYFVEIWYLVNPPTGSNAINVTVSAFDPDEDSIGRVIAGATSWTGVDQTIPLGDFVAGNGVAVGGDEEIGPVASVNVTSSPNEVVVDTVLAVHINGVSLTVDPSQTQHWNKKDSTNKSAGGGSSEPGASTVNMSWQVRAGSNWVLGTVPIKPVGASPSPPPSPPSSPPPSPPPPTGCQNAKEIYCYIVDANRTYFILWVDLDKAVDLEAYNQAGATCKAIPPAGSNFNYCLESPQ